MKIQDDPAWKKGVQKAENEGTCLRSELNDLLARPKSYWQVKKYLIEHIEARGYTKKEAIADALDKGDPHYVEVLKITARKEKTG